MHKFYHNIVFEKNVDFYAENCAKIAKNCKKSPKIVLITSTPGYGQVFSPKLRADRLVSLRDACVSPDSREFRLKKEKKEKLAKIRST
jgi:hypothetical protein